MAQGIAAKAHGRDGAKLFYRIYPQPGKPRLVLIHSLALDGSFWDDVVTEVCNDTEIFVFDCRGHGQSERRSGRYTAQLFADDLAAALDHCGWASAVVAGCSLGGCVAQAFGAEYPHRTQGLGLIDTTAWYGGDAPEEWRKRAATAAKTGLASMLPFQLSRWFSEGFRASHAERAEAVSRVFLANDIACYQSACGLLGSVDLRSAISSFRMPVSVIVGEEDYATPLAMAQNLNAGITGSALTVIHGGRHLTPIERPQEIGALLKNLIERTAEPKGVNLSV